MEGEVAHGDGDGVDDGVVAEEETDGEDEGLEGTEFFELG